MKRALRILLLSLALGLASLGARGQSGVEICFPINIDFWYNESVILKLKGQSAPFEGFLKTPVHQNPYEIKFRQGNSKRAKKYSTEDIEYLEIVMEDADNIKLVPKEITFVPGSVPRIFHYRHPLLVQEVYSGEHVKCFTRYFVSDEGEYMSDNLAYYYQKAGSEDVTYYWKKEIGTRTHIIGGKAYLKKAFGEFPGLVEAIDSGAYDPKEFAANPASVIVYLEEFILSEDSLDAEAQKELRERLF